MWATDEKVGNLGPRWALEIDENDAVMQTSWPEAVWATNKHYATWSTENDNTHYTCAEKLARVKVGNIPNKRQLGPHVGPRN